MNMQFTNDEIIILNKYMKSYPTSALIRKVQIIIKYCV